MDSSSLVDPELRPLLELFPTAALTGDSLEAMRARRFPLPTVAPVPVELTRLSVPGPKDAPDVPVHIYRPAGQATPLPTILHLHGGGYVAGSAESLEPVHRSLTHNLQCVIVSADYRLAPETSFPGNVEDAYAALAWAATQGGEHGIDASRIGVMGESAGGGLAAALALLARDRGEYPLAFQHLIYPMLDDRTCVLAEPHPYAGQFIWTAQSNHFGWTALLGQAPGGPDVSPYAAPARAEDLVGLPPTYIGTAALDLFVEENLDYARRLLRAGVPLELHVYPGAFHAFNIMPNAKVAAAARRDSLEALRRALHPKVG